MRPATRAATLAFAALTTIAILPAALYGLDPVRPARTESKAEKTERLSPLVPFQETGFLNRTITVQGVTYKFQVYLPEDYRRPPVEPPPQKGKKASQIQPPPYKPWPIILFLHGRGERGSEGMWQTQIGLPQQLRDHPERWPFIVVMPQCPLRHFWTDPDMLQMAMATLDQETKEFHADPERTYLSGLSLGGYGAWELAKDYPHRWAAIALCSTGIFWSYAPERWREVSTLKAEGGHVRLWDYAGMHHDCWNRAFNEPELPRWLLSHRLNNQGLPIHDNPAKPEQQMPAFAERIVVPLHPVPLKLPTAVLDAYVGEYRDSYNVAVATIQRQGDQMFLKNAQGEVFEIMAESTSTFFYPSGSHRHPTPRRPP
jgi:predicted peptidase